jgi:nucleotide-binding universal stress UspA family protein
MNTILVPFDFSFPAINALKFALEIATRSNSHIYLVHVIELPIHIDPTIIPVTGPYQDGLKKELCKKAINALTKCIKKYNTKEIDVHARVLFGDPAQMILGYADKHKIELIVMGANGINGLGAHLLGSKTEKIIRDSLVPVFVVKKQLPDSIQNIVFPNACDLDNQDILVQKVKALQRFFDANLHIVWINTPANFTSDSITHKRLLDFAKQFKLKKYAVHVFNHFNEEDGIADFTKMMHAELIAMGTHGRKGFSHLINGSVTEDIVNHAPYLVWTYATKNVTQDVTIL